MGVINLEGLVITSTMMPPNATEEIPWVEKTIVGGFRVWQVLFLAGAVLLGGSKLRQQRTVLKSFLNTHSNEYVNHLLLVITLCCCVRIRIPRTKQEIEADFRRKQLSKRFKQELKRIRNSELDVMDLRRGKMLNFANS